MAVVSLVVVQSASASWLSDITGVNIDLATPTPKVEIGRPNPAAIVGMFQNLPKDAFFFLLNPVTGPALAYDIRRAEAAYMPRGKKMPDWIKRELTPFYPAHILNDVRWAENDFSVWAISTTPFQQEFQSMAAVTANRVVIFKNASDAASNCELWAHELTHVMQYDNMGIEGFASVYGTGVGAAGLEKEASDYAAKVRSMIPCRGPDIRPTAASTTTKPVYYYRYVNGHKHGVGRLAGRQFTAATQKRYPAGGCPRHIGTAKDYEVTLKNDCPIPIYITSWVQQKEKTKETVEVTIKCKNCKIPANGQKTFGTPSKKPVVRINYRY